MSISSVTTSVYVVIPIERGAHSVIPSERVLRASRGIPRSRRVSRAPYFPETSGGPSTRPSEGLAQDDRGSFDSALGASLRVTEDGARSR